jgi:hypothetical protein
VVQAPLTGWQVVGGGAQAPAVQVLLQQAPLAVQAAPLAVQGVLHACIVGSQMPRQHCEAAVQAAPSAKQVSAPKPQRGGSCVSSQLLLQQPLPGPESQVSPVGRQSRLAWSIWHWPAWQMFEQQSAFAPQLSLSTLQSVAPQTPPLQPSEQQSSAFAQATPSATQRFVHCRTPDMPVTGSQRPLQQSPSAAQLVPEAAHCPATGAPAAPTVPPPWPLCAVGPPSALRPCALMPPHADAQSASSSEAAKRAREALDEASNEVLASMPYRAAAQTGG